MKKKELNNSCSLDYYKIITMTKADIVKEIAASIGIEKQVVLQVVEGVMETIKTSMINGEEVFLRGFGSFIIKHRAEKNCS